MNPPVHDRESPNPVGAPCYFEFNVAFRESQGPVSIEASFNQLVILPTVFSLACCVGARHNTAQWNAGHAVIGRLEPRPGPTGAAR